MADNMSFLIHNNFQETLKKYSSNNFTISLFAIHLFNSRLFLHTHMCTKEIQHNFIPDQLESTCY